MSYFDIPMPERVYLEEIKTQCDFGIQSLKQLHKVYYSENMNIREFWYHIQMFLTSTANVDKLLFGAKEKYRPHHKEIRGKYNFPDFGFSVERKIRNSFDHIDEEIVDWAQTSKYHNLVSGSIMSKSAIGGNINIDFFKIFDPSTNILSFGHLEIDTEDTFNKLIKLSQHIDEILT